MVNIRMKCSFAYGNPAKIFLMKKERIPFLDDDTLEMVNYTLVPDPKGMISMDTNQFDILGVSPYLVVYHACIDEDGNKDWRMMRIKLENNVYLSKEFTVEVDLDKNVAHVSTKNMYNMDGGLTIGNYHLKWF